MIVIDNNSSTRTVNPLPSFYTDIPPVAMKSKDFTVPPLQGQEMPNSFQILKQARDDEIEWLAKVTVAIAKETLDTEEWLSWSAHQASVQQSVIPPSAITALMPLFMDSAHTVAMIKHSIDITISDTEHLNPGQTPVLVADPPLYALTKEIQWSWAETHGEGKLVMMFGGLHDEMAILKVGLNHVETNNII